MANALEAASLVMIPSGYEDGTLGSLKPTDGSGDFTFSRGSNLSATRINEQGYIEKGYENLLLQSNTFSDATWVPFTATLTSGQEGYDGSNDAWLLTNTTAGGNLVKLYTFTGLVTTTSVYAKAGSYDWLLLFTGANGAYFDLANGLVGTTFGSQLINTSIQSIGGGWYRCSITQNFNGGSQFRFYPVIADGDISGTSGSIYIQDAMLNQGLVAYPYIETTTAPVAGGILEDEPRIDFSDGCGHLLLEPSRTNAVAHSEYLNGIGWSGKIGVSFDTNVTTSPEGLENSALLKENSSNGSHFAYKDFNLTNGSTYTISIFAKSNGANRNLRFGDGGVGWSSGFNGGFDLTAGTATGGKIEPMGNGWYRCSVTGTTNATTSRLIVYSTLGGANSYQGDGTSGVYLYGFQMEQDATYPTSYIPTYGVSQTRLADVCNGAGDASTFNDSEGVFYAEISTNTDNTDKALSINNSLSGGLNSRLWMGYSTTAKRVYALGYVNNSLQFALSKLMTDESVFVKIACKYALNDVSFFVNGEKVGTDTSALEFIGLNSLDFNIGTGTGGAVFFGNAKQVLYFPTALTDSECIALTTI